MTSQSVQPLLPTVLADIAAVVGHSGELKSDRIVHAFERQILSGRLPSGARLPTESELCQILGVSRSVVRDAIRTLVARGLVTVRQGRGTTVAEPSDAAFSNAMLVLLTRSGLTMRDVFQARATIETSLVGLGAAAATTDDVDALEAAYTAFGEAVACDDVEAAGAWHARFHTYILEAAHQPALTLLLRPVADVTIVAGAASVRRRAPEDWQVEAHMPILQAFKDHDPEAATKAMAAHYELTTESGAYEAFLDRQFADAYFNDVLSSNELTRVD